MSVTVITTTGNTYVVGNGADWTDEVTPTGDLAASVFDGSATATAGARELARFGNVEVVYLGNEVVLSSGPIADFRNPPPAPRSGSPLM